MKEPTMRTWKTNGRVTGYRLKAYSQGFHNKAQEIKKVLPMARKYDHEYKVQPVKPVRIIGGAKAVNGSLQPRSLRGLRCSSM